MKYLVSGGAGFIGSNISRELVRRGHDVIVVDNLITGNIRNLDGLHDDLQFVGGDVAEIDMMKPLLKGVDVVLHHAALCSVPRSVDNPSLSHRHNALATLNLLTATMEAGVERFVYASSSSVYGNRKEKYKVETMKSQPLSPYAAQKLMGEHYCKVFGHLYQMKTVCLRYFNVFGPRQSPKSQYAAVIPKFAVAMIRGESPEIHGDGKQTRDFTYVANNIHANILAAEATGVTHGESMNIATSTSFSLLDLVAKINAILGTNIEPIFTDPRAGDVKHSLADVNKAKELIGYEPVTNFDDGLAETVEWLRTNA